MTEKTIFLVRHAEPARIDEQKRYLGQQNPNLSPFGIQQAKKLARALRSCPIQAIFTSDLARAVKTASLIAKDHDCTPTRIREFSEINLGEWEGRTFEEVQSQYPDEYEQRGQDIVNYRTPGGESFADLQKRVLPTFNEVASKTRGNSVIVAHSGVNRVILCYLMHRPLEELFSIGQDYAAVNIIQVDMGNYHVIEVNMDLDGLMSRLDTIRN